MTYIRYSYYAFNCVMRWRAKRLANFYVSRNQEERELTAGDIAAMLEVDNKELASKVRKSAASLTGTAPYWAKKSQELAAMIRQLGTPNAFITHSAADIQWPDLHRYMPNQAPRDATEAQRQRINGTNVNENPALAAWWFYRRWNLFFTHVIKPLFGVKEWWIRFEWQHRGSSHVHGLIWMKGAPSPDELDMNDRGSVANFLNFWASRVTAINPGLQVQPSAIHPSALHPDDQTYTFRSLAQLINRVQRHTRCTPYCLRRPKGSEANAPTHCRFKFPQELQGESGLVRNDHGTVRLIMKRNDTLSNSYNPAMTLGWRANTDIQPCTDPHAIATYVSKYASKAEKPSTMFGDVMQAISKKVEEDTSAKIVFQKMLGRVVTERDYSAQEVCHSLLDCHMLSASREFGSLRLLELRQRRVRKTGEGEGHGQTIEEQDWRDEYGKRPETHDR